MSLFNLIIPCHNPGKTIERLFDSLTRQNISKNDLEIIVVDDNSDDLEYRKLIKSYDFNVIFAETNVKIHCPGNTRREGMKYVTGQWVCFCDQDDLFEDNSFFKIKNYININDKKMYVISTIMRGYSEEMHEYHTEFAHKQAWLHGKWYSVDNLIKPYNINFKENLVTHEDIYFNSLVLSILYKLGKDWDYLDIYTYKWMDNPESITRKPVNDRGYLFENFYDYLVSASDPFWKEAKKDYLWENSQNTKIIFMNQIMMTLLHSYFYYEAASYYNGAKNYNDILEMIKNYINNMVNELNYTLDEIVNFVYTDPYKYEAVKDDCDKYTGKFIPKTSFRDFVYKLGGKI